MKKTELKKLMLSAAMATPCLLLADTADTWVFDTSRRPTETVSHASATLDAPNSTLHALGATVASAGGTVEGRFRTQAMSDAGSLNSLRCGIVIMIK